MRMLEFEGIKGGLWRDGSDIVAEAGGKRGGGKCMNLNLRLMLKVESVKTFLCSNNVTALVL